MQVGSGGLVFTSRRLRAVLHTRRLSPLISKRMRKFLSKNPFVKRLLVGLAVLTALATLVVFFFPWDALRGSINRYVSAQLGRRFEITQHLAVHLQPYPWGRTTVRADGVEFANPEWANEPCLVKAAAAEFEIKLWPLVFGKVNMPWVSLVKPSINLQIEPDGRRTWALSRNTSDGGSAPAIGSLIIDNGTVKYTARARGADITVRFSLAPAAGASSALSGAGTASTLPLRYQAAGKWKNEAFTASGRTGGIRRGGWGVGRAHCG